MWGWVDWGQSGRLERKRSQKFVNDKKLWIGIKFIITANGINTHTHISHRRKPSNDPFKIISSKIFQFFFRFWFPENYYEKKFVNRKITVDHTS